MQAARNKHRRARLFRLLIGALILVSAAAQFALVPVMPAVRPPARLVRVRAGAWCSARPGSPPWPCPSRPGRWPTGSAPRRITLAAGLVMAAATAAQALAGNFPALFAARLAFGAGYGMVWTAGLGWLAGAMAGGPPPWAASVASAGVGGVAGPADLRRARPEPWAGRPVAGHRGQLRRDHRRAGRAPGAARDRPRPTGRIRAASGSAGGEP